MKNGDKLSIHDVFVKCYHTPCHTTGHILYYATASENDDSTAEEVIEREMDGKYMLVKGVYRAIFTGDTIFIGGCGRFFEGDAKGMTNAMKVAISLPDDTKMFCGHEYTLANLEFCLKVEKDNVDTQRIFEKAEKERSNGVFTVPTLLKEEKKFNVFMRVFTNEVQTILGNDNAEQCMAILREWKNSGIKPKL